MPEDARPAPPRSLDLFCGIGGLTLGLERAGMRTIGGVDHWEEAEATFEHNLGHRCMLADLSEVGAGEIADHFGIRPSEIDVIAGGPPCQGFSTVGKRERDDPRNRLWEHYRDLVAAARPAYVVIENVEGMYSDHGGAVVRGVIDAFAEVGYRMKAELLTSSDHGVPQLRKRVVFLGWLDGLAEPDYPAPTTAGDPVTVGEAIFDLPPLGAGEKRETYDGPPETDYQRARRGDATELGNHEAARHTDRLVEIISHVPDGGSRKAIPDHLQPKSGYHNSYSRLASWKPAVAITSNMRKPSSARCTHPKQDRGLTVREGLRLQGFDDDFVPLGSRTKQYRQVGNAVPPLLAEAVGREVVRAWNANAPEAIEAARSRPSAPLAGGGDGAAAAPAVEARQGALEFPG